MKDSHKKKERTEQDERREDSFTHSGLGLYKIVFTRYSFTSWLLCMNQPSLCSPLPPALPTLLQYSCTTIAQSTTPPRHSGLCFNKRLAVCVWGVWALCLGRPWVLCGGRSFVGRPRSLWWASLSDPSCGVAEHVRSVSGNVSMHSPGSCPLSGLKVEYAERIK